METKHTKGEWEIYGSIPDENGDIKIKTDNLLSVGVRTAPIGRRNIPYL